MATVYFKYDETTRRLKRLSALFVDTLLTSAGGGQVDFSPTTGTGLPVVTSTGQIDVWIGGVLQEETNDNTRNVGSNKITFVDANNVPANAKVKVRLWY